MVPFADCLLVLVFCLYVSLSWPPFFLCPPFILNSWAVTCTLSRTRNPVCISQLAVAGIKRGCLQMYGTRGRVSGAAERMCPAWQGPQIYGVDVPLHLWARDEKIPLFFFLTNTLPTLNVPLHSHSFSLLDSSCMPCCSLDGQWVSQGEKEGVAVWFWLGGEISKKLFCWS